jgi:hypothetical protein
MIIFGLRYLGATLELGQQCYCRVNLRRRLDNNRTRADRLLHIGDLVLDYLNYLVADVLILMMRVSRRRK